MDEWESDNLADFGDLEEGLEGEEARVDDFNEWEEGNLGRYGGEAKLAGVGLLVEVVVWVEEEAHASDSSWAMESEEEGKEESEDGWRRTELGDSCSSSLKL